MRTELTKKANPDKVLVNRLLTLIIAYNSGCRVGDLQRVTRQVNPPEILQYDNTKCLSLYMDQSKTNNSAGRFIQAWENSNELFCPVKAWTDLSDHLNPGRHPFHSWRAETPTETGSIVKHWRRMGKLAGLTPAECLDIKGHSVRRAVTAEAAENSVPEEWLKRQCGWSRNSRMPDHYARAPLRERYSDQPGPSSEEKVLLSFLQKFKIHQKSPKLGKF